MRKTIPFLLIFFAFYACRDGYEATLIDTPVPLENETARKWTQGWLSVPENRKARHPNAIELPFVYARDTSQVSKQLTPILIMSGGPGNGSLHMANGSTYTPWASQRDLVVMDQRGTGFSKPALRCPEIDSLVYQAKDTGLCPDQIDEARFIGIRQCYERLTDAQIDLSGYHTLESVEDLEDLRQLLNIPKWILYGMSYSCNLMAAYAQTYPGRVEAMILDSPLPHHVDYDAEAYFNADSVLRRTIRMYGQSMKLYDDWNKWVETVRDSTWELSKNGKSYCYDRSTLIDLVVDALSDHSTLPEVVTIVRRLIQGDHTGVDGYFGNRFRPSRQAKGMRYTLWIGEELSEEDPDEVEAESNKYPWLEGYALNDVSFSTAQVWQVKSIYDEWQWPQTIYHGPVLILSGELDPWTPEWYGREMLRYTPNAVHTIYPNHSHVPGFTDPGMEDIAHFLSTF